MNTTTLKPGSTGYLNDKVYHFNFEVKVDEFVTLGGQPMVWYFRSDTGARNLAHVTRITANPINL